MGTLIKNPTEAKLNFILNRWATVTSLAQVPPNHDPECLVLVPRLPNPYVKSGEEPFASIIALQPGEVLSNSQRLCIAAVIKRKMIYCTDSLHHFFPGENPVVVLKKPVGPLAVEIIKHRLRFESQVQNDPNFEPFVTQEEMFAAPAGALNILRNWKASSPGGIDWKKYITQTNPFISDAGQIAQKLKELATILGLRPGKPSPWDDEIKGLFQVLGASEIAYLGLLRDVRRGAL